MPCNFLLVVYFRHTTLPPTNRFCSRMLLATAVPFAVQGRRMTPALPGSYLGGRLSAARRPWWLLIRHGALWHLQRPGGRRIQRGETWLHQLVGTRHLLECPRDVVVPPPPPGAANILPWTFTRPRRPPLTETWEIVSLRRRKLSLVVGATVPSRSSGP